MKPRQYNLGMSAVHTDILLQELKKMILLANENLNRAYSAVLLKTTKEMDKITQSEEEIDILNREISQYISKILVSNNSGQNVLEIDF